MGLGQSKSQKNIIDVVEQIAYKLISKQSWKDSIIHAKIFYEGLLRRGVAKEQARAILPLSQYTQVWWTASFQSIMNFIELRDEATAQVEIQEYAKALKKIMLDVFPETTKLWEEVYWK